MPPLKAVVEVCNVQCSVAVGRATERITATQCVTDMLPHAGYRRAAKRVHRYRRAAAVQWRGSIPSRYNTDALRHYQRAIIPTHGAILTQW